MILFIFAGFVVIFGESLKVSKDIFHHRDTEKRVFNGGTQ
jgi:hypothetical protein